MLADQNAYALLAKHPKLLRDAKNKTKLAASEKPLEDNSEQNKDDTVDNMCYLQSPDNCDVRMTN